MVAGQLLRSLGEIGGVVFLRFPWPLRVWAALLVGVNAEAVLFINTIYGQVALAAVGVGAVIMVAIHARWGFVRLLGLGHVLWIPMLPWMLWQLPDIDPGSWLHTWMLSLIVLNAISLVVDTTDVVRFIAGDRKPYYMWQRDQSA